MEQGLELSPRQQLILLKSEGHSTSKILFAVDLLKSNNQAQAVELTGKVISEMTVSKAWDGTQISKLKKIDSDDAFQSISLAITTACQFFNIGKNMNTIQVAMTAELIMAEYWHFKLEEILFVFKNAMASKYGKVYDRLDGEIILGWLKQYDIEERGSHMERNAPKKVIEEDSPIEALKTIYQSFLPEEELIDKKNDEYAEFKRQYAIKKLKENSQIINGTDSSTTPS